MEFRTVDQFISEMLRAADEVDRLTKPECARLLRRAAATIKAHRDEIDYYETPANDAGPGDVVFDLNSMTKQCGEFPVRQSLCRNAGSRRGDQGRPGAAGGEAGD
jgi:hypothetical protein